MRIRKLLESNVGRARGKKILLVSECIASDCGEILNMFGEDYLILTICPEAYHINHIGYKLLSFIKYSDVKHVAVLSVEGSYHCLQLHHLVEDIAKHFAEIETKHYVLVGRKIYEICEEAVRTSRHLLRIEKYLSRSNH